MRRRERVGRLNCSAASGADFPLVTSFALFGANRRLFDLAFEQAEQALLGEAAILDFEAVGKGRTGFRAWVAGSNKHGNPRPTIALKGRQVCGRQQRESKWKS